MQISCAGRVSVKALVIEMGIVRPTPSARPAGVNDHNANTLKIVPLNTAASQGAVSKSPQPAVSGMKIAPKIKGANRAFAERRPVAPMRIAAWNLDVLPVGAVYSAHNQNWVLSSSDALRRGSRITMRRSRQE